MRAVIVAATALAISVASLMAGSAQALTVQGRVLKGEGHEPTSGVPVSLHVVNGTEELPGKTATSGAEGEYRFDGLAADPHLSYFVSTEYEGAVYTEGPVEPAANGIASQDLTIYDVGREIAAVHVTNHHIIVERKPDLLQVTEIVVFENSGKTAYLGTGLNHAENAGIRLGLPASVKEFQPGMGGDPQSVRVQGRDLASLRPIPPGTHPFSFTYNVPLSGRMDLSHRLYFPTAKFVVLIEDPKLHLESASLRYAGQREQNGRKFELYQGADFPIGAEVTMRIQGAGFWSNPKIYPWVVAPFLIVAALMFAAKKGRGRNAGGADPIGAARAGEEMRFAAPIGSATRTSPPQPLPDDDLSSIYLFLIDALDRGLERGEFSKESHALVRGNLKRRLEAILSDQPRAGTR
ncbi:MAG: carboxypeptidase regulatory-like domain-containing protein [Candidatus Eisenbacteria bacterium]|uniref:Carboxypeptidase regulatory-like domain-containing protein n=1 Tax=Eiseniibacteriota bacterium TaxID=2212470 RepID=A0A538TQP6_UNCEI|nr:MAG: carboxypeptidase regulatory-like domain-containing protein [Candidatus Eisenbacteria bacterium]